ncbi:sushi, von Willebrand factor type A, EGF and pentraxin domain-containing protein 1-like [Sycon ciliatum]|uniref:sushi, von Willebrand factor type A, EGF and pentraxin domain-containing protein 1-like n=1 Tax=Sycon ciliatum TaxID=27933 RepID=UPI0031F644BF
MMIVLITGPRTTIQLQCQSGYLPCLRSSGCILPSQRCNGVWYDCADGSDAQYCPGKVTPAPGQIDCQVLSPPALGSMTVNGSMFSNTTTFVCTSPYVLMGSAVRTCEINGQWSGVQPTCVLTTAALSAASDELVKDSVSERMTQTCQYCQALGTFGNLKNVLSENRSLDLWRCSCGAPDPLARWPRRLGEKVRDIQHLNIFHHNQYISTTIACSDISNRRRT